MMDEPLTLQGNCYVIFHRISYITFHVNWCCKTQAASANVCEIGGATTPCPDERPMSCHVSQPPSHPHSSVASPPTFSPSSLVTERTSQTVLNSGASYCCCHLGHRAALCWCRWGDRLVRSCTRSMQSKWRHMPKKQMYFLNRQIMVKLFFSFYLLCETITFVEYL